MRKNYYVFLNMDVFWNASTSTDETITALKLLFNELSKQYDVNLVISSNEKEDFASVFNFLYDNEVLQIKKVEATRKSTHQIRGLEMKEYLKEKPDKDNYSIIDNDFGDIVSFMNKNKTIKVSLTTGLELEQINEYLIQHNIIKKEDFKESIIEHPFNKEELTLG